MYYRLTLTDRQLQNREELLQAFAAVPVGTTQLDISNSNLNFAKTDDLIQAFSDLGAELTDIIFCNTNLHLVAECSLVMKTICQQFDLERLDLESNQLGELSGEALGLILHEINAKTLSLDDNDLQHLGGEPMSRAFEQLGDTVKKLSLRENSLSRLPAPQLTTGLGALRFINTLDLSINDLNLQAGSDLKGVFQSLSQTITALVLRSNNLGLLGDTLATALEGVADHVETLDISHNEFIELTPEQLNHVLATPRVTELIVCQAGLGFSTSDELATSLSSVSPQVKKLLISKNNLELKSAEYLADIFAATPESVEFIWYNDEGYLGRDLLLQRYPHADDSRPDDILDVPSINENADPVSDYSFYIKCLAGLTLVAGASLLVAGIILLKSALIYTGTALLATSAASVALSSYSMFSNKPSPKSSDQLPELDSTSSCHV